jgi:hypothetical protein
MARVKLSLVLADLEAELDGAKKLASALNHARGIKRGPFTESQYLLVVELAYLRGFLAWESFLEQTFLLYMVGKNAPSGFAPKRYVFAPSRQHARDFSKGDQRYPDWTAADRVVARANRFFKHGEPYAYVLSNTQGDLKDMKAIRNAIAHQSQETNDSFRTVVRKAIGFYPKDTTVGEFLDMNRPNTTPSITIMEHYFTVLVHAAREIVPS